MSDPQHYIYLTRLVRPGAFGHLTPEEQDTVGVHFRYLQDALASGDLVMAGPCLDGAFGIVVFRAESDEAARAFMANDPAIRGGVMTGELHPIRLSLLAGR